MGAKIVFGLDRLPRRAALEHGLVCGATGSGKTLLLNRLITSVFKGGPERSLVYDAKSELLPFLGALGCWDHVRVLAPFDSRGVAWDLATDIDGPLSARQFATHLIPEMEGPKEGDRFWLEACREVAYGTVISLMLCTPTERAFTFRDVVLCLLYPPYLKFILGQRETRSGEPNILGRRIVDEYLEGDPKTVKNLRTSLNASIGRFEPLAAAWDQAWRGGKRYSLKEWVKSKDILVLGNDEAARAAVDPVNRMLFNRATELLLAEADLTPEAQDTGDNFTWCFFDEIREAGRLDLLPRLMLKGRSKGVAVFLGAQTRSGMVAVYGSDVADELLGQCGNLAILKLNDAASSEWAASLFGKAMLPTESKGHTLGQDGVSQSSQQSEAEQSFLQSGHFLYLPKTGVKNGLSGYFRNSYRTLQEDGLFETANWDVDIQPFLTFPSTSPEHADRMPRPASELYLKPWDQSDWTRLGFGGAPPDLFESERGWE